VAAKALRSTRHGEVTTTSYLARIDIPEVSLLSFKMAEPGLQQIWNQKKRASVWRLPVLTTSTRPESPLIVFLSARFTRPHAGRNTCITGQHEGLNEQGTKASAATLTKLFVLIFGHTLRQYEAESEDAQCCDSMDLIKMFLSSSPVQSFLCSNSCS